MKKLWTVVAAILFAFAFTGCADNDTTFTAHVYMPDGAPAIGMAKMIADGYEGAKFNVVAPIDIGTQVLSGNADLAILPTNAAAKLGAKAGISMVAVTNFGSLYLVGNGTPVTELAQLKGKVVYSIGQGNVPDLVFRILLDASDVEYTVSDDPVDGKVSLAYVSEGTEFISGMTAGVMQYGVISEPAATVAQGKVQGCTRMLSIQTLYADLIGGNGFPQAALVVKNSFLADHRAYVQKFVEAFQNGVTWAETEPEAALAAIQSAGSTAVPKLTAAIAKGCNLGFTWAANAKENLTTFYGKLQSVDAAAVGATLPADGFYLGSI